MINLRDRIKTAPSDVLERLAFDVLWHLYVTTDDDGNLIFDADKEWTSEHLIRIANDLDDAEVIPLEITETTRIVRIQE